MNGTRVWTFIAAVTMLATGAGCSRSAPTAQPTATGGSTSSSAAPSGATVQTFTRLNYRISVPAGWVTGEGQQDWVGDGDNVPGLGDPAFDSFSSPAQDPWFVIGKRPVVAGLSLPQWIKKMTADRSITFSSVYCDNTAEDDRPSSLGGEKARLLGFTCPLGGPDTVAVQMLARHKDQGWFIMCVSEAQFARPLPDFERQCEQWLSTLEFLA